MENSNLTLCTNNKGESENKSVDIPKEKGSDKVEGDVKSSEEEAPVSKKKSLGGARGPMSIDLSNPEFLKPFDHGWVREVVYRSRMDTSQRRHADVYYYTPLGKKVRFSRETLDYLSDDTLTLDNFTFYPREIGVDDPTKEIVREARSKNGPPEARRLKTPGTLKYLVPQAGNTGAGLHSLAPTMSQWEKYGSIFIITLSSTDLQSTSLLKPSKYFSHFYQELMKVERPIL